MLTYQDCIGLSALTEEEVAAVAEHEHIPAMFAIELGNYIVRSDDGVLRIRRIILDDIEEAERNGNVEHALKLKAVLKHFVDTHPEGDSVG